MAEETAEKNGTSSRRRRVVKQGDAVVVTLPAVKAPKFLQGFVNFVREQGVVGLAVGLILGVAAKSVIDSLVNNIFNPVIGLLTGGISLEHKTACIKHVNGVCTTSLGYGRFISDLISFFIVAAAVYFVVIGLKLDKLDRKKEG
jgi:large conductance mechanosensitive channel